MAISSFTVDPDEATDQDRLPSMRFQKKLEKVNPLASRDSIMTK